MDNLEKEIRATFNCSYKDLEHACWNVITHSNDYYGEGRGEIVGIKRIPDYKPIDRQSFKFLSDYYNNYGVYHYCINYEIYYKMYNSNGTPCSTTVYFSSFNGGILSHGINCTISFPAPYKSCRVYDIMIKSNSNGEMIATYYAVAFGGILPSFDDKSTLLTLICKKLNASWTIKEWHSHVECGSYRNCDILINRNVKSCTDVLSDLARMIKQEPAKKVKISKMEKLLGTSLDDTLIYKVWYVDGTTEFERIPNPTIKREDENKNELPF